MGMNTTILIMNDYVHEISIDPKYFVEQLIYMIGAGKTGEVIPGVKIIESHHADDSHLILVGGNIGTDLGYLTKKEADEYKKKKRSI